MRTRFLPLPELKSAQAEASEPRTHAALSASAGSGKTQVLTARVLRLLLQGARPESILCLTFTKAAAAEMANRIGRRLALWVRLKDSELGTDLLHLGESNDPRMRQRARQLFAKVLDCPGGLKIQTIHSFAQSLLAAFPAEAGVVPGFQPIEGRAEQELVRRTLADLLADADAAGDQQLMGDVQCLSRRLGESGAVSYLQACAAKADVLERFGPPDTIETRLRNLMNLPESVEDYLAAQCGDDGFDCDLLRAIAQANRTWGKSTGLAMVDNIERWMAMTPAERAGALPDLASIVFTGRGELRKVQVGQLKADPNYERHAQKLADRIAALLRIQSGSRLAGDMAAGLRAGQAFARAYTGAKRAAGVADFNDLIEWTRALLRKPGMGDWVRYKLDRQIDHVLIDEAQDTNAAQWEIVEQLVDEFFSGGSETERRWRTLFMVGDFKQAIYGFQGTDPGEFEQARREFRRRADELLSATDTIDAAKERAREFRDLSIAASFRSAQPVLDVVDAVVEQLGHQALALPEAPGRHIAHHIDRAGLVELWPAFEAEEPDEDSDQGEERWVELRARKYAGELAVRIRRLIDEAPILASTGRPLTAGDILVLVRSRGELASLLVARLYSAGVPVAGVDRLHLHEPLAVQDLLAAIKFAVQPGDDLGLASLLVSPFIGWDQDALRELAYGRSGTLWRALRERASEKPHFAEAHSRLADLLRIADFVTPVRFLETILSGPMQGRRKLYSRLSTAARDAIDELMNSAVEFERSETPSLDRFLDWFSRGEVDVQRDAAQPGNEVRVLTVHGAKGLEAPVVILADATSDPSRLGRTPIALDVEIRDFGIAPVVRPKKEERQAPFAELIAYQESRDLQEHWRLLYVAMTRAADRLIVSGIAKGKERPADCWHRAVEAGLAALGAEPDEHGVLRHGSENSTPAKVRAKKTIVPELIVPDWARAQAPPEARPPRPLAPSAVTTDADAAPPPTAAMRAAAKRGTVIHQLLERLPDTPAPDRASAAQIWLEKYAEVEDPGERREIAEQVLSILENREFKDLFGTNSLAEAPLAATLPDGRVIAGTVDRLLVEQEIVSVIDFKTGREPTSDADIPPSHRAQMLAYVEALATIFPNRRIRATLLYTAGPRLFEITA